VPLTPQDVRAKLFTSVRFKHGYDEDEVDAFLDQVETDLGQLYAQIESLTADLEIARSSKSSADAPAEASFLEPDTASFAPVSEVPVSFAGEQDAEDGESQSPPRSSEVAVVAPTTTAVAAPASDDAPSEEMLRRTLLLAQRTADALISEARAEAEALVTDARTKAEEIERSSTIEHAGRQRDMQLEHDRLAGQVDQLRNFENEYRSRLRAYLHLQLRDLENSGPVDPQPQLGNNSEQAALNGSPPDANENANDEWPNEDSGARPEGTTESAE